MEKQRKITYQEVSCRVERLRQTYSRIGEPLPADMIIDLCRHLGSALELMNEQQNAPQKKRRTEA